MFVAMLQKANNPKEKERQQQNKKRGPSQASSREEKAPTNVGGLADRPNQNLQAHNVPKKEHVVIGRFPCQGSATRKGHIKARSPPTSRIPVNQRQAHAFPPIQSETSTRPRPTRP
ncbi:hypothetical protein TW95_gp0016 [Pandoravirus inopinatum]|uniref:Uncharacterized protein n=1 Tax=Pandoravirus inopinatum TaxID=1605721 RepID=A0A0B5J558_9VIRU|nr:hypothetical protein TW95_gp0016 [Pandoravirus inopinatum]AJF96750.1 hypothetical protein [Pandoravirus inopinatum]